MPKIAKWRTFSEQELKDAYNNSKTLIEFIHFIGHSKYDYRTLNKIKEKYNWFSTEKFNKTNINLIGQHINNLTVLYQDKPKDGRGDKYWVCKCDCGNPRLLSISTYDLINNKHYSCGCIKSKGEFLIGQILQKLKIKYITEYSFNNLKGNFSLLRFDFAIFQNSQLLCLIEYQGKQHFQNVDITNFLTPEKFKLYQEYDDKKRKYCQENNIPLIEISYADYKRINDEYLIKQIEKCTNTIWHKDAEGFFSKETKLDWIY